MKTTLVFITLVVAGILSAQNPHKLYPVKNTKKLHGYINAEGKQVIDFKYDWVGEFDKFNQGMVRKGDLYGLINHKGEVIIPIEQPGFFYQVGDYYIIVDWGSEDKKKLVFDKNGKSIDAQHIQPAYERKLAGIGDLFVVRPEKKTGVVSLGGKFVIEPQHNSVHAGEDHFLGFDRNMRTFYNKNGKKLFSTKFNVERMSSIAQNRIPFRDSTGYAGYMDTLGNIIIEVQFAEARPFSNGRAMVKNIDKEWAIIDLNGKVIGDYSSSRTKFEHISMSKDRKFGVINQKGTQVVPNKYISWFNFCNNRAFGQLTWEGDYELIDTTGKSYGKFKGQFDGYNPVCFDENGIVACGFYDDSKGAQYDQYVTRDGKVIWKAGPFYECFPEDAQVNMADGYLKSISEVKVGDKVISKNGTTIVTGVDMHEGQHPLLNIKVLNSGSLQTSLSESFGIMGLQELRVTKGHPIMTSDGPMRASELIEGQIITMRDDFTGEIVNARIMSIALDSAVKQVWNLATEDDHYFVNGIMVLMK